MSFQKTQCYFFVDLTVKLYYSRNNSIYNETTKA